MSPGPTSNPGDVRPAVAVRGLTRSFGGHIAVHPTDLELAPGTLTGLLGPNGAGKSTLMRMMIGLVPPDAGSCTVAGAELRGDGTAVRRRVTYAPGELALYGELTARRHMAWFQRGRGRDALARGLELLRRLGLPLDRRVGAFSHGMKRLLLVAAALAPDVPVRILDEPTEGLDPSRRGEVLDLLRGEVARGTTILLSSHHLGEVEEGCDRVLFLREGALVDTDAADAARRRVRRALRLRFAGEPSPADLEEVFGNLAKVRVEGSLVHLLLPSEDPRPVLERIANAPTLPMPTSVRFGELSLTDLYGEIYGTEAV
ncbi:MAG TPA: ABC transporter ATP-binding protein [Planctomycetes bacterium]|nr:ABC transporter ATP-binding protein [Planctomycetota bacterium]